MNTRIIITISHNGVDKRSIGNSGINKQSKYRNQRSVVNLKEKSNGQEESKEDSKEDHEEEDRQEGKEEGREEEEEIVHACNGGPAWLARALEIAAGFDEMEDFPGKGSLPFCLGGLSGGGDTCAGAGTHPCGSSAPDVIAGETTRSPVRAVVMASSLRRSQ
jgi:hypothetical protein